MEPLPPSRGASEIPSEAWTGRKWWQICCGGCCLLVVLFFGAMAIFSYWYTAGLPKDFWKIPQAIFEKVKQRL